VVVVVMVMVMVMVSTAVQLVAVDPHFKLTPFVDDQTRQRATAATLAMMERAHEPVSHLSNNTTGPASEHTTSAPEPSSVDSAGPTLEHPAASSVNTVSPTPPSAASSLTTSTTSASPAVHQEFTAYTSEPTIPRSECPLSWWAANRHDYPLMANVARRLLSIPATTCCSGRLYTKQHETVKHKRDRVELEKDEQVLFCMENL